MKSPLQKIEYAQTSDLAVIIAQAKEELARGKAFGPFTGTELDKFFSS